MTSVNYKLVNNNSFPMLLMTILFEISLEIRQYRQSILWSGGRGRFERWCHAEHQTVNLLVQMWAHLSFQPKHFFFCMWLLLFGSNFLLSFPPSVCSLLGWICCLANVWLIVEVRDTPLPLTFLPLNMVNGPDKGRCTSVYVHGCVFVSL